jgi:carboxypeptidase Taq
MVQAEKTGTKVQELKAHLADIHNLGRVIALLHWDQRTQMPVGGIEARAAQGATLSRIEHELWVSDKTARLLEDATKELDGADYNSDEASLVRVIRQDYQEEIKLPTEFVTEMEYAATVGHTAWVSARANNDFKAFLPALEKLVELTIQRAEYLGYTDHPYDALVNQYERGITAGRIKEIFDAHKPALVELIAAMSKNDHRVSEAILRQPFDLDKQRQFALDMVKAYGFDFTRGRQDVAVHPFCTHFSRDDVRITTRFYPDYFNPALFGMMHEAGHGLYEQGIAASLAGTPLEAGTSLGVHESQSRMWENLVGRSKGFWTWALPKLKETFPAQFGNVDLETFYRAINKMQRGYIRVEADEATYNLHIMLRFELEMALVAGKVKVADLPKEWNGRFESFFGIVPPTDTLGVLQDVHWSEGLIGYFPTYALGNLLSVQYYNKAVKDRPSIPDDIASGKFDTLLTWLQENIHQHGRKFTSDELTRRVTGESIQSRDYIQYLQTKFGEVYGL